MTYLIVPFGVYVLGFIITLVFAHVVRLKQIEPFCIIIQSLNPAPDGESPPPLAFAIIWPISMAIWFFMGVWIFFRNIDKIVVSIIRKVIK